ncbi:MAG: thioredoxin family protein [Methyloprofundus sp.]|nr:thioredoxin family protein [Methyloprofundus sp.]MDT8425986.1 thioredoxin family protein [Methyloprofundus sp.]
MKKIIVTCFLALLSFTASAQKQPFNETLYQQYQDSEQVYLVDVFATWCPTCKKQSKIIDQYFSENPDSKIKVLVVDYDDQKKWVSHFRAPRQSTLLLYKGKKQLWFSVAETNKDKIFTQLKQAEK